MPEQVKKARTKPATLHEKRLFVDLELCAKCPECVARCDYFYHPENNGITSVRERAVLSVICRRCENPVCVSACTKDALEKDADGVLRRYNMRCVGCKSCSIACPFGTLIPEIIPYAVSVCDYCLDKVHGEEVPTCVETCPLNAIRFEKREEDISNNNYAVDEHIVVHAFPQKREAVSQ
jgi:Fe-S-cluster-containing dehydrogenase component